jgi:ribosomal protein L17
VKPDLIPATNGALSQEQMQKLFRAVADKDLENDKKQHDYTYVERDEEHRLDGKGEVKSTEVKTSEVMELYGEQVERLIEKDDKPLSEKDAAKEEERIQKLITRRKNESENERRKRAEKGEKDREEGRKFVREVADAYNFKLAGTERLDGREVWVIDGEPRPGYEPHLKGAKFLPKFRGRIWIDKNETQWTKLDIQCIDTVSLGWFLARVHKGSRVVIEQTWVNDEVWLPKHISLKVDVRVALLKEFNVEQDQTYRNYKKFRASARIVGIGEVKP